jgi:hypothetical protein
MSSLHRYTRVLEPLVVRYLFDEALGLSGVFDGRIPVVDLKLTAYANLVGLCRLNQVDP